MELKLKRIILFSQNVPRLAQFYEHVIGLRVIGTEPGWVELDAGGCAVAIHKGKSTIGSRPPKIVFYSPDVAATRAELIERGMTGLGSVKSAGTFQMCDGRDIDGNAVQISSRT